MNRNPVTTTEQIREGLLNDLNIFDRNAIGLAASAAAAELIDSWNARKLGPGGDPADIDAVIAALRAWGELVARDAEPADAPAQA